MRLKAGFGTHRNPRHPMPEIFGAEFIAQQVNVFRRTSPVVQRYIPALSTRVVLFNGSPDLGQIIDSCVVRGMRRTAFSVPDAHQFALSSDVAEGIRTGLREHAANELLPGYSGVWSLSEYIDDLTDDDINTLVQEQIKIILVAIAHVIVSHSKISYEMADEWRLRAEISDIIGSRIPYARMRRRELLDDVYMQLLKGSVRKAMSGRWGRLEVDVEGHMHLISEIVAAQDLEDLPTESEIIKF